MDDNKEINLSEIYKAVMSSEDFKRLSSFIYNEYGIKMPEVKKTMLQSRLHKRLRELGMTSYKDYVEYLFSKEGQQSEVIHMIDMVSTNKTDFFREPVHFDFLHSNVLPELLSGTHPNRSIKIWSAGCSSGEEPYTIAMSVSEYALNSGNSFDFSILATDISTRMLKHAVEGIYKEPRVEMLPMNLKKRYLLKSKDRLNPTVRMIPDLRRRINFQRLNFMDNHYNGVNETFDIVFCRNVLIYFDRETQERVINKLCTKLKQNGIFFLGHSESITNFDVPLNQIKPTIFRKK